MTELYYEKRLTGQWYDERLKITLDVMARTFEKSQKPNREKALGMALLSIYPNAGEFEYADEYTVELLENMPVYLDVDVSTMIRLGVIGKS